MSLLSWLWKVEPGVKPAASRAKAHVKSIWPDAKAHWIQLRASEPDRFVFAVFYSRPGLHVRPPPYCLVAVPKGTGDPVMLDGPEAMDYRIRNYR